MKRAFEITAVPGLFFSEWGPGDMGVSHGHPDWHDPPYAPEMDNARNTIQAACEAEGLAFLCSWADPAMDDEARARHLLHNVGARTCQRRRGVGTNRPPDYGPANNLTVFPVTSRGWQAGDPPNETRHTP